MSAINPAPKSPHDGHRLFQAVTAPEALLDAWEKVKANDGAAGGDGVSCQAYAIGAGQRLRLLSEALRDGSYRPGPLRRVDIPKPAGGVRRLTIPSVKDRIAQTAAAQALSPLFEAEFEDSSFGYRPGRSVKQALERVQRHRAEGYVWTLDADIEAFFDSVPHERMMARLLVSVSESPLSALIELWLETGGEMGRGLAQGSPLSPLLANLYLDGLDEALSSSGLRLVRFADDFVVLAKSREAAERGLEHAREAMSGLGLALHPEKTRIKGYDESLKFLGKLLVRSFMLEDPGAPRLSEAEELLRDLGRRDREAGERMAEQVAEAKVEARAGYDRGLRVLYVMEPGRRLGLKNQALAVFEAGDEAGLLAAVHASGLDRVEIGPHGTVDTEALRMALAHGVETAFVDGHGRTLGTLAGRFPARARRQLAQARHTLDPSLRLDLARRIVAGRISSQRAWLRRANQRRGLMEADETAAYLSRALRKLPLAKSVQELLGHEGEATARYWRAWSGLLLHGWSLKARERRPAPDLVNAALNAAASLLERDLQAVIGARGLHLGFGALHTADDGAEACVYDLMELFRAPLAEGVVHNLFNTRALRREHSEPGAGGERLTNKGFTAVIRGYEERARSLVTSARSGDRVPWRRILIEQAEDFAAHVEGGKPFTAYTASY